MTGKMPLHCSTQTGSIISFSTASTVKGTPADSCALRAFAALKRTVTMLGAQNVELICADACAFLSTFILLIFSYASIP